LRQEVADEKAKRSKYQTLSEPTIAEQERMTTLSKHLTCLNRTAILLLFLLLLGGCAHSVDTKTPAAPNPPVPSLDDVANQEQEENRTVDEIDLAELKPNEVGQVMILMYHQLGEPEGEWTRTPENFRSDLELLYNQGYRLISLNDFLANNINVPAGYTPVILTFDDGTKGHFNYLEADGQLLVDPNCALGILMEFSHKHPDFGFAATFYVYYGNPFGQSAYIQEKFNYLAAQGLEIGNHTYTHANLKQADANLVQKELVLHIQKTQEYLPGYWVRSLALPYGADPKDRSLLVEGSYEGLRYKIYGVLLVGAEPAPAPNHKNYDPYRLPRVRADEEQLHKWLTYFQNHPEKRYISDGNPDIVTIPMGQENNIAKNSLNDKELRIY
jgi:peptidoglycan/xylan/chitin deacetylase (PgdA/CDA1 family)